LRILQKKGDSLKLKKYFKPILIAVIILICLIYICMLYSTRTVIDDFEACVSGKEILNDVRNSEFYDMYYRAGAVSAENVKVTTPLALHNFNKGVMYVKYTYEAFDEDGSPVAGSYKVPSKWYIEKQNGRWIVTKIDERP
jgi:hypothetical protein